MFLAESDTVVPEHALTHMLSLEADFGNEDSVKEIIAKQQWSISRKTNAVDAYDNMLRMQGKTWTRQSKGE